MINGYVTINGNKFDFLFDEKSFEIIIIPTSLEALSENIFAQHYDSCIPGSLYLSDKKILFLGVLVYRSTINKFYGVVDNYLISYPYGEAKELNKSNIYIKGGSVNYISLIGRASTFNNVPLSLSANSLTEFSFTNEISNYERINYYYEPSASISSGCESNQLLFQGVAELIISDKEFTNENIMDYFLKILSATQIITNSIYVSFNEITFEIIDGIGQKTSGQIFSRLLSNKEIKPCCTIYDFDNYKYGIGAIVKSVFSGSFKYATFLRDDYGDCFSYERQFKLFSAFDYYYKLNCNHISFSEPDSMTQLKNDMITLLENNKTMLVDSPKKNDYYKKIKKTILNYDNSMSKIIKCLVFDNFIKDKNLADNFATKMNDYRNGIVHGHDFKKVEEDEHVLINEISYWDFVIYERLLLYIALYNEKDNFDLSLFCKQLYAL